MTIQLLYCASHMYHHLNLDASHGYFFEYSVMAGTTEYKNVETKKRLICKCPKFGNFLDMTSFHHWSFQVGNTVLHPGKLL